MTPARRPAQAAGRSPTRARRPAPGPARVAAFEVLRAVDERDGYANLLLPAALERHGLAGRDAHLATELVYGTLRGAGTYDAVLAACLDRPPADLDPPLLDVLRLGAHQLLGTRIPAHAAVSQTVGLARRCVGEGPAALANAVLRRVAAADRQTWVARVAPASSDDPVGHLAIAHSHPRWIVEVYREALGGDLDETAAALAANNQRPLVTLAARPGLVTVEELVAAGARPGTWSPYAAVMPDGDPRALAAVAQGRAGVQDEGSQLAALALARAPVAGTDRRWLDVAAGPGGKAALLAGLAAAQGARLLAAEVKPHRAALVAGALAAWDDLAGPARVVVADGTRPSWRAGVFDRVLLDAPCTGLGSLRRRPEARWRRGPADVHALAPLQRSLLRSALDAARPGGVVGYVTCSPHLAETRAVVDDVLAGPGRPAVRLDARAMLKDVSPLPALGDGPDVQLWPHRHGTDAMHISLLRAEPAN